MARGGVRRITRWRVGRGPGDRRRVTGWRGGRGPGGHGRGARFWAAVLGAGIAVALGLMIVPVALRSSGASPATAASASAGSRSASDSRSAAREPDADEAAQHDTMNGCERRLEQTRHRAPVALILGASYTAGVGPGDAGRSWAVVLARALGWNAVVYGVSGAGYVSAGWDHQGPLTRMLDRVGLSELHPALVIVQLGHDDTGVPPATERRMVEQAITRIRTQDPRAKIALVTVFTVPSAAGRSAALWRTDQAIVSAARTADKNAIIMDPLAGGWTYPRADNGRGLHPTAAGDAWIAAKVGAELRAHGVRAVPASSATVVCDQGVAHHAV